MKKTKILSLAGALMLACTGIAHAGITDVVQAPTDYFVPDNSQLYDWPYYRWYGDDWSWQHNAIGGSFTTATLNISAWDVDAASGEVDNIYALDSGSWTLLGSLAGLDNDWGYTTFNLGASFFDDIASGLQVKMDIDSTHTSDYWAVTLAKSVLSLDGGTLPNPNPGPAVPEPSTLILMGAGLASLAVLRKRFKKS